MPTVPLSVALRDLESRLAPIYLVAGEEPFQASEFSEKLRKRILGSQDSSSFNYDVFDAEQVAPADLLASLDTLPGLFDDPNSLRLVVCRRFEKASAALIEALEAYFKNPSPHATFLILAEKVDKRKAWFKEVDKTGVVIEVADPWDRDWPKWKPFFEKRTGKSIGPAAWDALVESAQRTLSLVASEVEKAALFVGDQKEIQEDDVRAVCGGATAEDVFQLSEDIVARRPLATQLKLHQLLRAGESEIKILSLVLRLFRQVAETQRLQSTGVRDTKTIGAHIGVPPFFVSKIQDLARGYQPETLGLALKRLADCDYRLKRGEGSLWADFIVPHFQNRLY